MILKSLGGWEPCLELNYSLSKRRGESDRQDMCAVIQVNWRMTSKCRFLLDVRDGAPSCDCWQVALSRWQCGAWGQGSRGSRGALRGTEGCPGAPEGGAFVCAPTVGTSTRRYKATEWTFYTPSEDTQHGKVLPNVGVLLASTRGHHYHYPLHHSLRRSAQPKIISNTG